MNRDQLNILAKVAARLTKTEKRERAIKFTALGAASGPVIAGAAGVVKGGYGKLVKNITQGTKFRRWLPATAATGALVSGAVPALRHQIERDIIEKAKERRKLMKNSERLLTLVNKTASLGGQDLRAKFSGMHANMPTKDSTAYAGKLLNQSSAEVGPMPKMNKSGPTLRQLTPPSPTNTGGLPKMSSDTRFEKDPLVQWIQKQAEELDRNEDMMFDETGEAPTQVESLNLSDKAHEKARQNREMLLAKLFENKTAPIAGF